MGRNPTFQGQANAKAEGIHIEKNDMIVEFCMPVKCQNIYPLRAVFSDPCMGYLLALHVSFGFMQPDVFSKIDQMYSNMP